MDECNDVNFMALMLPKIMWAFVVLKIIIFINTKYIKHFNLEYANML